MQAIILCGGLGTRLRSVIGECQKTMTETNGEPFLVNIIKYLKTYNVDNVIFSVGYKSEQVKKYFGYPYYFGVEVHYAEEKSPLGTGGAIRNCLEYVRKDEVIIVNGDTLFPVDLNELYENYVSLKTDLSIACKHVDDKKRYGTIKLKEKGLVDTFMEKVDKKDGSEKSYINGGVYVMSKELIKTIPKDKKISLESELIPVWLQEGKIIGGVVSNANFIDIGTPESLEEFKRSFSHVDRAKKSSVSG